MVSATTIIIVIEVGIKTNYHPIFGNHIPFLRRIEGYTRFNDPTTSSFDNCGERSCVGPFTSSPQKRGFYFATDVIGTNGDLAVPFSFLPSI